MTRLRPLALAWWRGALASWRVVARASWPFARAASAWSKPTVGRVSVASRPATARRCKDKPNPTLIEDAPVARRDSTVLILNGVSGCSWEATLVRNRSSIKAEKPEEVGRINKHLPGVRKPGFASQFAPQGRGLGKVAGRHMLRDLIPLGRGQDVPEPLVGAHEALEKCLPILRRLQRRLVKQEKSALAGGAAHCAHQAELVAGREVMDRQAAPRHIGVFGPAQHRLDEIAVIEIDLERNVRKV